MFALVVGVIGFLLGFLLHVAIWRRGVPKESAKALTACLGTGLVLLAVLLSLGWRMLPECAWLALHDPVEYAMAFLFATSIATSYLLSYPAVEIESPSLTIAGMVAERGRAGLSIADLEKRFPYDKIIQPRIDDLYREGYATRIQREIILTSRGTMLARIFVLWRNVFLLQKGG